MPAAGADEYNSSMPDWLLPLFPLRVVLFPRTNLALHIFEERYKQMIAECLQNRWEFGVVLVQDRSLAEAGCTAFISEVVRKYPDGRMDILVRGQRRFELLLLDQEMPYLRGEPQFFDDEAGAVPSGDARRSQALDLYKEALEQLPSEDRAATEPPPELEDPQLSYQIIARLPAELSFKQALLQLRSEDERITQVISHLQKMVRHLAVVVQARERAGSNGRGR